MLFYHPGASGAPVGLLPDVRRCAQVRTHTGTFVRRPYQWVSPVCTARQRASSNQIQPGLSSFCKYVKCYLLCSPRWTPREPRHMQIEQIPLGPVCLFHSLHLSVSHPPLLSLSPCALVHLFPLLSLSFSVPVDGVCQ